MRTEAHSLSELKDSDMVWRYMDLAKLTSLLVSEKLWFSALWKLDDPFEGVLPVSVMNSRMEESLQASGLEEVSAREDMKRFAYFSVVQANRLSTFVNCWNVDTDESIALWKIYGRDGIVVQTTVERLRASLPNDGIQEIQLGIVDYQPDPENNPNLTGVWPEAVLTKDLTYSYEQELRLFFTDPEPIARIFDAKLKPPPGRPIAVDLSVLIDRIVVSPFQSEWFEKLVRELLVRLGMSPEIVHTSTFRREPIYRLGPSGGLNSSTGQ